MQKILIVLAMAILIAGQSYATDKTDVMNVVKQFVDAFDKGDTKAVNAICADETLIIDEFPPHEWHGAGACEKWSADYDTDAKKNGITDGSVTLTTPRHIDVTGDRAYVVYSANYAYKQNGKPVKEIGSIFTLVLAKGDSTWRVTAWSWAKH